MTRPPHESAETPAPPPSSSPPPSAAPSTAPPDVCVIDPVSSPSCAPDTRCSVRVALRIECASSALVAFGTRGADRAAIVTTSQHTWLSDFGIGSAPRTREIWGSLVLRAALAPDAGGYRLVAADSATPRLFSISVDPAQDASASTAEWIDTPDARAVTTLLAHRDGRFEAFVVNGSNPGPFRVFTRASSGGWSVDTITDQRVGDPIIALDSSDRRVTIANEATARPPYGAMRMRIEGQPDVSVAWNSGTPRGGVWPRDTSVPVLLVDMSTESRIMLLDDRLRPRSSITIPAHGAAVERCVDDPAQPGLCHTRATVDDPAVLAPGPNGLVWVASIRHHLDLDQSVEEHCLPVDPPGRAPPNWRPPNTCERHFTPRADRSTAELVVRSVDSRARNPSLVDRTRVPIVVTGRRTQLFVAESDGALHVLVSRAGTATLAEYIALDEAAIVR